ncbi:biotin synthase [Lachnospiraceae bacterium PF1-21]|uniref:Biotin synthase n=1 Tax=Ohessyouella blattaphilus TaxID=2949333 RepID=A0ABT1EED3_9FIRM|nr:biotin synthase BioB [Ohessyouella blattaphilus]MCP1109003.1 biotin synthase BioB [Ohessyouella blattaphilus]MCR8562397.1 biotin synthase BioB [Ohessyouella blattaphilus]MDL2249740.1 biotin synthase BioB [Lachnospiraceae bacterium OttesenSCG-928-J05]
MSILENVLAGQTLTVAEANVLMDSQATPLSPLIQTANTITRQHFGTQIDTCAIYPAKVGRCSGNCAFCAQSTYHDSNVRPVAVNDLSVEEIIDNAKSLRHMGVNRYSLVTSGEHLTDTEFARILHILQRLNEETSMALCASLGSLTPERASSLKNVGVSRYHHNIETSASYFPNICTTHTYDEKLETIHIAREAGLDVCCGGIIAMGESPEQLVEMAFALKELDIDSIPINILNPLPGTRLEKQAPLSVEEILRTIAVFRLILPDRNLRFAGGRERALKEDEYLGYTAGINAMIVGNYLTTPGKTFEQEKNNLARIGLSFEYEKSPNPL